MKTHLECLQASSFFETFEAEHLEHLARHTEIRSYATEELLFEEDQSADALYMLVSGMVRLSFRVKDEDEDTREAMIRNVSEPGQAIGWSAMVEPHQYRARATAAEPTQLLVFQRSMLDEYCEKRPDFGIEIMPGIFDPDIFWRMSEHQPELLL